MCFNYISSDMEPGKFSFILPSCKSLDIYLILDIYRHIETAELGIRMSLTNQDISQPSLCHLSLGTVAQWLERLTGDQKVAVRFPSGAQKYFLF